MPPKELPKVYDPREVEEKWYSEWEKRGLFHADELSTNLPFSIVIPPPNITGSLHMGHALNNTLQDILIRWKRMNGFNTLWLPGTDHAGIATQNVVERQIAQENSHREDYGRARFVQKVWQWREQSGRTIIRQLKRLGASCDWQRERFTLDEGLSDAVREVFVRLYGEGLIYRGDYIINWCPRCHTALSDLEVEHVETRGKLYLIRYPFVSGEGGLIIATTRPETLLGDTAVAVHPEDDRYRDKVGQRLRLPILNREIPVIADPYVDREFGTGALKITPAHDPNDYELGQKHGLVPIRVMSGNGQMNELAGPYAGLDRFECRKRILHDLREEGLLVEEKDYLHAVGHCYRCKTVVEPTLSKQWFVKMKPLAEPAIEAVMDGRIRFIPKSWEKTYFEWMNNIKDWCISRQIWWGHQIPAWYCRTCHGITVDRIDPTVCKHCGSQELYQEEDVLDTWFSSALWPFSTLGWPKETEELKRFYPTSALVTAFDILFFWVARMIMMGLKFKGEIPFRDVYIHALVRDAEGQKMSKSKGNVIDPLEVMDRFGTDALRFTLASMASPGRDIKLSEQRIEGYRNFANKIWNASRFILMQLGSESLPDDAAGRFESARLLLPDRWILSRLQRVTEEMEAHLSHYRFDEAAHLFYQFFWYEFCDGYLEFSKLHLQESPERKTETLRVLRHVLDMSLRLLHPFMPYITEEIWQHLQEGQGSIMVSAYPRPVLSLIDPEAEEHSEILIEAIRTVRRLRSELSVSPGQAIQAHFKIAKPQALQILHNGRPYLEKLCRLSQLSIGSDLSRPSASAMSVTSFGEVYLPLAGLIDIQEERARLQREMDKFTKELSGVLSKLSDPNFRDKAPSHVVEKEEGRSVELKEKLAKLQNSLTSLE
ncbi:MAG: valine--tRNA ligase [Nitrospirae bacterium]|nr:valine--tRNA ligase [Nitrospirota bacterium]